MSATEILFTDAIRSMTDAELAHYRKRYTKVTDHQSLLHSRAVRDEIARRRKAGAR